MSSKEKILVALKDLILEKGITGVSVRSVAKKAGVNHGLVHHYFGSKENMVVELIEWLSQPVADKLSAMRRDNNGKSCSTPPPINDMLSNPEIVKVFWECLSLTKVSPEIRNKVQNLLLERRHLIQQLFSFENKMDIWLLQAAILGMVVFQEIEPETPVEDGMYRLFELLKITSSEPPVSTSAEEKK